MTSRIVLDEATRAVVNQIQDKTKASSPSHAIALMVSRYAKHLLGTWELDPTRYLDPNPTDYYPSLAGEAVSVPAKDNDFKFADPLDI